ncbi:MAG: NIL domain-containing protein [bacterium]
MIKRKVVLIFPASIAEKPITYKLIKDYDLVMNIIRAKVTPNETGRLVLELNGEIDKIEAGLNYMKNQGVIIDNLAQEIRFKEGECIDCGACIAVCRVMALSINPQTSILEFDREKCILCEKCVQACPLGVIEIAF